MILPMNDKQFGFWKMRRSGSSNITIANLLGIRIEKTADPTKLAEELFTKVKVLV